MEDAVPTLSDLEEHSGVGHVLHTARADSSIDNVQNGGEGTAREDSIEIEGNGWQELGVCFEAHGSKLITRYVSSVY